MQPERGNATHLRSALLSVVDAMLRVCPDTASFRPRNRPLRCVGTADKPDTYGIWLLSSRITGVQAVDRRALPSNVLS